MKLINVLSTEFVKKLYHRKGRWKVNLKKFNKDKWFDGVYNSLGWRVKKSPGDPLKYDPKLEEKLKDEIFELIYSFPDEKEKIDLWYKKTIIFISKEYPFNMGRSQKLINLLIKYFITSYYSGHVIQPISKKLVNHINKIHIPIDNIVLKESYKQGNSFKNFITNDGQFRKGMWSIENGNNGWTNWEGPYPDYEKFQIKIREKRKELFYNSSLEFEMKELWE